MMEKPWDGQTQEYKMCAQESPAGHEVAEVGYIMSCGMKKTGVRKCIYSKCSVEH